MESENKTRIRARGRNDVRDWKSLNADNLRDSEYARLFRISYTRLVIARAINLAVGSRGLGEL